MTWKTRQRSDFGALAAIRAGSGTPVLLLHGVGLRAEAWGAQIDTLAQSCAIIAPDLPGHGMSPAFSQPPTLADYTDRVAAALKVPVRVAGHSMGAMIALDLAIRYPNLVHGAAALNAIYRRAPDAAASVRARADALDTDRMADPAPTLTRWFGDAPSSERDACQRWLSEVDPRAYKTAYQVFASEDGPPEAGLRALACPALFMTGADEPNSTAAMSQAMAAATPQGRAVIVPDAAHMMPMTHARAVNDALSAFIAECAP